MATVYENHKRIQEGFLGQKMIVLPPEVHNQVTTNPLISSLYLTAIGFYPHANYHDRERATGCTQYIFLYCIKGKGTIKIEQEIHLLEPNCFFIIPPNIPHHYYSSPQEPWSIYWVHFEGTGSEFLYTRYLRASQPKTFSIPYNEKRIEVFNLIVDTIEDSFDQENVELANINLLQFLSSFIYQEKMNPSLYLVDNINRSIKYMKENLNKNFSLENLAMEQNISVSHYSDLFKKKIGVSPIQYFNQLKIHKACQYLYFTDMNIQEICLELGFSDPYYFSRLFKKSMKVSPLKYKNSHRKGFNQTSSET